MTGTTEVIKPLNEVTVTDINNSRDTIDKWLKDHTYNYIGLDTLANILGTIPVIGNIMAGIDVVSDIFNIYDKGYKNADVFDWSTLGMDLIGVVPVPGVSTAVRSYARPTLFLVRQEVKRGKGNLTDSVILVISNHINDGVAGNIETFANSASTKLNSVLTACGGKIQQITIELNNGIVRVVENGTIYNNADANKKRSKEQAAGAWDGVKDGDFYRAATNTVLSATNLGKSIVKNKINKNAGFVSSVVPQQFKQPIINVGATIGQLGVTANTKIKGLGNAAEPQTIGWLVEVLRLAAARAKKRSVQLKDDKTTKATNEKNNNRLEKTNNESKAQK
jgi:hypothetical protein